MSDPAIHEVKIRIEYLDIAIDYLMGMKYKDIQAKYNCNNGYIQYALEKAGVETNRIKSGARFNGYKKKKTLSKELKAVMKENSESNKRYDDKKRHIHCTFGNQKDNNPVHLADDLDIMERMNGCDGVDSIDDENLRYEIVITEEGEIRYEGN